MKKQTFKCGDRIKIDVGGECQICQLFLTGYDGENGLVQAITLKTEHDSNVSRWWAERKPVKDRMNITQKEFKDIMAIDNLTIQSSMWKYYVLRNKKYVPIKFN